MKNINVMIAERKKVIDEMRSITAAAETRNDKKMTDAEGIRWGELNKQVDAMKAEIETEQRMQSLEAENASTMHKRDDAVDRRKITLGEDVMAIKEKRVITGMSELVPADGGYLVETDHVSELFKQTYAAAAIAGKCRRVTVGANANGLTMNASAETSRVSGHHWGGITGHWLEEGGLKEYEALKLRRIELRLKKLAAVCALTDELLQDATALNSIVSQAFVDEFQWILNDAVFNGVGGGQPVGLTGHPSLVTVNMEPGQAGSNTILYENIVNMYCRMVSTSMANAEWYVNQDCLPQLYTMALAVGFGGVPVYMPAGLASAAPYGTLMGKNVNVTEHNQTLGNVGDIAFLDLSQYLIIEKGGINQASSIHVRFLNDETILRFVMRVDGQPLWNNVLTPSTGSANTLSPFIVLQDNH